MTIHPTVNREDHDLYETPDFVTDALIERVPWIRKWSIVEPCCGSGRLARRLRHHGIEVVTADYQRHAEGDDPQILASVLDRDAQDRLYVRAHHAAGEVSRVGIVTNPPYKLLAELLPILLNVHQRGALLLELRSLERTHARRELLERTHTAIQLDRVEWLRPDGSTTGRGTLPSVWLVFGPDPVDHTRLIYAGERRGEVAP